MYSHWNRWKRCLWLVPIGLAIRPSVSEDFSSAGCIDGPYEMDNPEREKMREKRDKERRKEMAKVEKEKESDEGMY